jgi:hypothetical protein
MKGGSVDELAALAQKVIRMGKFYSRTILQMPLRILRIQALA